MKNRKKEKIILVLSKTELMRRLGRQKTNCSKHLNSTMKRYMTKRYIFGLRLSSIFTYSLLISFSLFRSFFKLVCLSFSYYFSNAASMSGNTSGIAHERCQ